MVQIDNNNEDGSDTEDKALIPYQGLEGENVQASSHDESNQNKPHKFLENIVLTQDDHPPIQARPCPTSMPDQGETTMRWEVDKGKFLVLGTQLTSKIVEFARSIAEVYACFCLVVQGLERR